MIVVLIAAGLVLTVPIAVKAEPASPLTLTVVSDSQDGSTLLARRRLVCLRVRWLYKCVRYQRRCTYRQRGVCLRWAWYCVAQRPYRKVCDKWGYR
jgi:hypothetical protein